jgi:hypothetical protein
MALSDLVHGAPAGRGPREVPRGAWDIDNGVERCIGATTRSWLALFLVPFMCVWSGFSIGGIYGSQLVSGKFNPAMSAFGIPFVLGTLLFGSIAAMSVCGKVEVRLRGTEGRVFTGIGPIGWARRFELTEFSSIREDYSSISSNRQPSRNIVMEGSRRLAFGTGLSEARRYFVIESLRPLLRRAG